jgi:hypothetical protein
MTFSYPKITEAERRAPKGKFRTVAVDTLEGPSFGTPYLVGDYDSPEEAIERAGGLDEGPYMGSSVADDTGTILFPEGSRYRVPEATESA